MDNNDYLDLDGNLDAYGDDVPALVAELREARQQIADRAALHNAIERQLKRERDDARAELAAWRKKFPGTFEVTP